MPVQPPQTRPATPPTDGPAAPADRQSATRPEVLALGAGLVATLAGGLIVGTALVVGAPGDFHRQAAGAADRGSAALLQFGTALLAGFSTEPQARLRALVTVLAVAVGVTVALSVALVTAGRRRGAGRRRSLAAAVAGASCALAAPLPTPWGTADQLAATGWGHGPTMLAMPFAVGLFGASLAYLRAGTARLLAAVAAAAVLTVVAGSSLVVPFLVVFPAAAWWRLRRPVPGNRARLSAAWAVTAGTGGLLALRYAMLPSDVGGAGSWWSAGNPLPVLGALAFPLVALALGGAAVRRDPAVRYALALTAVGLLTAAIAPHGGPAAPVYLLFVALVGAGVPALRATAHRGRQLAVGLVFVAHLAAGLGLLTDWLTTG